MFTQKLQFLSNEVLFWIVEYTYPIFYIHDIFDRCVSGGSEGEWELQPPLVENL